MSVGHIPWGLQRLEAPLACKLNCNIGPFLGNYSSQNKFPANVLASAVMKVCSGDKNIFPYSVGAPDYRWKYFPSFQKVQHFESAFVGVWKYFYSFHLKIVFLFSFEKKNFTSFQNVQYFESSFAGFWKYFNSFHLTILFLFSFENTFPFFHLKRLFLFSFGNTLPLFIWRHFSFLQKVQHFESAFASICRPD